MYPRQGLRPESIHTIGSGIIRTRIGDRKNKNGKLWLKSFWSAVSEIKYGNV